MNNFEENYIQIFYGIELCLENKLQFPTLSLIYSTIDSLAWIAYGDIGVGSGFKKWVDEYMFKEKKSNITPIDLYSARCAIIHTLTPNSRDSNKKQASVIAYAWGNEDVNILEKSIENSKYDNLKVIHINDLFENLKLGTLGFINSDHIKQKDCLNRMEEHYMEISKNDLENYNKNFE
ncbi:MAG: hypothetical protein Q8N78_01435 [Sulfurimonas sp.]|nr:hypothetical protein [Sulfurimonas sp.]